MRARSYNSSLIAPGCTTSPPALADADLGHRQAGMPPYNRALRPHWRKLLLSLAVIICVVALQCEGAPQKRDNNDAAVDVAAAAAPSATTNDGLLLLPDLVEGDIRVTSSQKNRQRRHQRHRRQTINSDSNNAYFNLWPRGIVPYSISNLYKASSELVIRRAMEDIQKRSCIRFVQADDDHPEDHLGRNSRLVIKPLSGCWSYVGRLPDNDQQEVSLQDPACMQVGIIQHELLHALGFVHTQSRPDRDRYVQVLFENVAAGLETNFFRYRFPEIGTQEQYDYYSAMHYRTSDFAARAGLATVIPRSSEYAKLFGNRMTMSYYDEKALNYLYSCSGNCTLTCQNDGYARMLDNGSCICKCPKGLGGPNCEDIDRVNFPCGDVILLDNGIPATVRSPNYPTPYPTGRNCAWLIKAPYNEIIKLHFAQLNLTCVVSNCRHFLDVRKNLIGQPSPQPISGIATPEDMYSKQNAVLILFDASDYTVPAGSGFEIEVASYQDGCLGNPCNGARCHSSLGTKDYTCLLSTEDIYCNFERSGSKGCSMLRYEVDDDDDDFARPAERTSWETLRSAADADYAGSVAPEGVYYLSATLYYSENNNNDSVLRGRFRIPPVQFSTHRCLTFRHYVYGNDPGLLRVYRAVNGKLGLPIFEQKSSALADAWRQTQVTVRASGNVTDLIEVVFEALYYMTHSDDINPIAVDDLKYTVGACGSGPCAGAPCAVGLQCTPVGPTLYSCAKPLPDGDVSTSFEVWEDASAWLSYRPPFEVYTFPAPGRGWSRPTGARGPASGFGYLYARLYNASFGTNATLKIGAFAGKLRCLTFKYSMYGQDMGNLSVYQIATLSSGAVSTSVLWSKKGNQGDAWFVSPPLTIDATPAKVRSLELAIVATRGGFNYACDMAVDDVKYTEGKCPDV